MKTNENSLNVTIYVSKRYTVGKGYICSLTPKATYNEVTLTHTNYAQYRMYDCIKASYRQSRTYIRVHKLDVCKVLEANYMARFNNVMDIHVQKMYGRM